MKLDVTDWIAQSADVTGTGMLVTGWSVDTRTIAPGDLYFALRGPSNDGHDYVEEAIRKGAVGVEVDHEVAAGRKALVVKDTLAALQSRARWARKRWGRQVSAGTGSAGKTTTKDTIAHL